MTLATRCPACHTSFKVVKDQLRLADGWVRCGRCDEIFLAADALALSEQAGPAPTQGQRPSRMPEVEHPAAAQTGPADTRQPVEDHAQLQAPEPAAERAPEAATARPSIEKASDLLISPPGAAEPGPSTESSASAMQSEGLPEPIPERSAPMRHYVWDTAAPQRAPRSPWATAAWGVLAGVGLASLVTQAALAWHDELLHAVPSLKPVLEVACVMAECRLEPVRRLQALSVEASQLSQLGGTIYQFNATVRNRSAAELAAPALDLVLTGSDGQVIARKVLRWADFGLRSRSMAAQQEVSLQTNLNTGTTAVAGFTIELFYP